MFGFGSLSHLLIVLALALILIGPKQLPEVARALGKMFVELRRASNIFTDQLKAQMDEREKPSSPAPQNSTQQESEKNQS